MAELVDALVLGTSGLVRGGSSPSARTITERVMPETDYERGVGDMQCLYGTVLLRHESMPFDVLYDLLCELTNALCQDRDKAFKEFCNAEGKIVPGHGRDCVACGQA